MNCPSVGPLPVAGPYWRRSERFIRYTIVVGRRVNRSYSCELLFVRRRHPCCRSVPPLAAGILRLTDSADVRHVTANQRMEDTNFHFQR